MSKRAQHRRDARARHHPLRWGDDRLSPATRLAIVEHILQHVDEADPRRHPEALTERTRDYMRRVRLSVFDPDVSVDEHDRASSAWVDYVWELPEAEREEAVAQDVNFAIVLRNMPDGATCPGDWFRHVMRHGLTPPDADD